MIFYFTGTGNSLHAALALADEREQVISITKVRRAREFVYERGDAGERIGFVFPEYCSSMPDIVLDFVQHLEIHGSGYTFAVVTCGGNRSFAAGLLADALAKRGVTLDFADFVMMPNNCVTVMDLPSQEEIEHQMKAADEKLHTLKQQLAAKATHPAKGAAMAKGMRAMYHIMNTTKPFYVEDSCTGCGMCVKGCPDQAIKLENGKPVWIFSHCDQCTACINRCPVQAIQYGKKTKARSRYSCPSI